jgi:hypothetical protein
MLLLLPYFLYIFFIIYNNVCKKRRKDTLKFDIKIIRCTTKFPVIKNGIENNEFRGGIKGLGSMLFPLCRRSVDAPDRLSPHPTGLKKRISSLTYSETYS